MNYDQMTLSEMEEIWAKLKEEIEKRRNAVMRGDWEKLIEQIQFFTMRYGLIDVRDEKGNLFYIVSDTDFNELGVIHIYLNIEVEVTSTSFLSQNR